MADLHALQSWSDRADREVDDPPSAPPAEQDRAPDDAAADAPETRYRLHRRFDRLGRLLGDGAVSRLMGCRVAVFGLGGVGSFAAEALSRSAIGQLALVDFDRVCITNTNRQLPALSRTVGKMKADVLAERLAMVNPSAEVVGVPEFYKAERADTLLSPPGAPNASYDFVVDCIDNLTAKAHLIATCKARGIPVVSSMGAAGKLDPTRVRVADLGGTHTCRMARDVRRILRRHHGFPEDGPMGVPAVFSDEPRSWPRELSYDEGQGFRCVCPHKSDEHGCDSRQLIDGTAVFVTGAFGLACSSVVIRTLSADLIADAPAANARMGTRPADA